MLYPTAIAKSLSNLGPQVSWERSLRTDGSSAVLVNTNIMSDQDALTPRVFLFRHGKFSVARVHWQAPRPKPPCTCVRQSEEEGYNNF